MSEQEKIDSFITAVKEQDIVLPSHKANLRRALLTNFKEDVVMKNKNRILPLWFKFISIVATPIIILLLIVLVITGQIGNPKQNSELLTVNGILIKAAALEKEKLTAGNYRHLYYYVDFRVKDGANTKSVNPMIFQKVTSTNPNVLFTANIQRDPETGRAIRATVQSGSDFQMCFDCKEAEFNKIFKNLKTPDTTAWNFIDNIIAPIKADPDYGKNLAIPTVPNVPGKGVCGTDDGTRVVVHCYGMRYIQAVPFFSAQLNDQIMMTKSKDEFVTLMETNGFEKINTETKYSEAEQMVYDSLISIGNGYFNLSDLYANLLKLPGVQYLGQVPVEGDYYESIGFETATPNGKSKITMDFKAVGDKFELQRIERSNNDPANQVVSIDYGIIKDEVTQNIPGIEYNQLFPSADQP